MNAMIFAAGLGTRLKPLTDTMPKALVRVGGKPLLGRTIETLANAGASQIVVNVHHFADQVVNYLTALKGLKGPTGPTGLKGLTPQITISDESKKLLDTGGGIKKASQLFTSQEPILIHNVDILSNVDLRKFYTMRADADALLLVSQRKTKRYLLFDDHMRLAGWTNIETGEIRSPYPGLDPAKCKKYAFSGIHIFSPSLFPLMDEFPEKFGIMDFYLKVCAQADIRGYVKEDLRLLDVGKLDTLAEAETFTANEEQ